MNSRLTCERHSHNRGAKRTDDLDTILFTANNVWVVQFFGDYKLLRDEPLEELRGGGEGGGDGILKLQEFSNSQPP